MKPGDIMNAFSKDEDFTIMIQNCGLQKPGKRSKYGNIKDIEYFRKKLYAAMKIPDKFLNPSAYLENDEDDTERPTEGVRSRSPR